MIRLQNIPVELNHFPDGALLLKESLEGFSKNEEIVIKWNFENNEELLAICFLAKHIKSKGLENIILDMPYIPNARQDRVINSEDVFTLKYFAEMINSLGFKEVRVFDAHSNVSLALIDRVKNISPSAYIKNVIEKIKIETGTHPVMFYPDAGAGKRYSGMVTMPYCFGIKNRDWETGRIKGLEVAGETGLIKDSHMLIVDDICSYGGTFLYSAQKLKELGAKSVYIFVSHCERNILDSKLIGSGLIKKIYTTDSIFNKEHEIIEVL